MNFKPTLNYTSPGQGLPAPDPFPSAKKPHWRKPRRKRHNPKDPWSRAYSGDVWRKPYAHEFYRFKVYRERGIDLCQVMRHRSPIDPGSIEIDAEPRIAGPRFKDLAVEKGLRPVRRAQHLRNGPYISFWNWPEGFVQR